MTDRDADDPEAPRPEDSSPSPSANSTESKSTRSQLADDVLQTIRQRVHPGRESATRLWRWVRSLSLHGSQATRPLQIALRATGLVLVVFAPLWPLFGSEINGWWDWFLTMLANMGIGIALFGAGEVVRMIAEIHSTLVSDTEHDLNSVQGNTA
ncbi:MAG: hypothetical protein OXC84_11345 [Gammaproteobacteria bacterium]|nr:hypothetical protein [Gammaproteobacteria bacterium]